MSLGFFNSLVTLLIDLVRLSMVSKSIIVIISFACLLVASRLLVRGRT